MVPLTPKDVGFIADMRVTRPAPRRRRLGGRAIALGVILASIALGLSMLPAEKDGKAEESGSSQQSVVPIQYLWKVYVLNQTGMSDTSNGTAFSFRTEDLPYDFGSILFGDFRTDPNGQGTYYGGCGILVEASGSSSTFVLREAAGKYISTVSYNGQDPVVFSGERRSVSYPNVTTSCYGTDIMVQDWKNGTWTPEDGILVEHQEDATVLASELYIMVFEPDGDLDIPEFDAPTLVIAIALCILTVLGHRTRRTAG